ncbi:RdlA protein [Streptomyces sp. RKND-216]|uniref:rodlin n=1 Tax=Streptomyces sp. RKND-216 TaxID=2562581 RepID=UPI00109DDEC1|nr:rodlin [Streptomyces sp. RKND-216]THA25270.1 RdlA protein [Streptomyces sp. RKND-216]
MLKKVFATAAVAASVVGASGAVAAPAMAVGDVNENVTTQNGNKSDQVYGNTTTGGHMSPNMALVNGSLNKPCVAVPVTKTNVLNGLGLIAGVNVNDVLTSQNNQNCTENSTQVDGDDPLSHLLSDGIPVLSQNGAGNGNGE